MDPLRLRISEALWIGLHAENGMNWYGRDPLNCRDWAKICLATLFRLALSDRDDVSPHVIRFSEKAMDSGYRHVEMAFEMAMSSLEEECDDEGFEGMPERTARPDPHLAAREPLPPD